METRTTVWPFDILNDPHPSERDNPNHLRCFLICPFEPQVFFDDLYNLIQDACNRVGKQLFCKVECRRADKISSAGIIHAEIWHEIQTADVVIADVTALNGNVLLELGVASACRKKEHIIIIREENQDERFLFDIGPARHIVFRRTFEGFLNLLNTISHAILMSLTSAPFEVKPKILPSLPLSVDFTKSRDVDWLVGPSITHRRLISNCLEFGSLFVFRNSWLSIANLEIPNFKLTAEMRFTHLRDIEGWIGISVRNHHFFANYGHLFYLTSKGKVIRTVPENELGKYHDELIGNFSNFKPNDPKFYKFKVEVNEKNISMYIDDIGKDFKVAEMPYVYPSGKIIFQTYNCRVGIQRIELQKE